MRSAISGTNDSPGIFTFYEVFFKGASGEINRLVEFCRLKKPDDVSMLTKQSL